MVGAGPGYLPGVNEVHPGVWHWTVFHERIRQPVHSYLVSLPESTTLIDPMVPEEGIDAVRDRAAPDRIVLTNRHHLRHSERFVEAFGCPVLCHEAGLHEFADGPEVTGFSFGDEVAPGVTALEVGALTPEETALHIPGSGALAVADGVIRYPDGALGFVPDVLMGDDPGAVKDGLRESYRRLLELDFDNLLMAHGEPVIGEGRRALREFVERDG